MEPISPQQLSISCQVESGRRKTEYGMLYGGLPVTVALFVFRQTGASRSYMYLVLLLTLGRLPNPSRSLRIMASGLRLEELRLVGDRIPRAVLRP